MTTHETTTQGSCRCGQVQLTVHGRPLITMACHCTGCQRMTASAFSLSSLYPEGAVTVSGTEPVLGGLHGDMQHFCCPHCKSWVFTRAEIMGPFVNVRSTMLDDAASYVPFVDTMTSETLQLPFTSNSQPMPYNLGSRLLRMLYHYWYHTGENAAIRQMLGHTDLPQFIGEIEELAPYRPE